MANDFNIADGPGVPDGSPRTLQPGQLILGDDGTNLQTVQVTTAGVLKVDGSAVTQPVSSVQLPAALVGGRLDVNIGAGTITGGSGVVPVHQTVAASSARTATFTGADITNTGWNSAHIIVTITSGTGFYVRPVIEAYNATGANYYPIAYGATITALGTYVIKILPGSATENASVSDGLPLTFRVRMIHADSTTVTYSVGVNLQLI